MSVVYVDLLFLLNFVANYLLLLGAGRISGAILIRWRIAMGAVIGALYAVLLFVPGLKWLALWPCKVLFGIVMPIVAFGKERALLRIIIIFFVVSSGLAGLVLAVEFLGGAGLTIRNGVLYSNFDLRLLILLLIVFYFVMSIFCRRAGRHVSRETVLLTIRMSGKSIQLTALLDSGHTLTDPATNKPVVIVHASCFAWYLPDTVDLQDPVESMRQCREYGLQFVRLIPYRAVGVDCGMLLALKSEEVFIGERSLGSLLVALSPTPLGDGSCYQALIGGV